MVCECLLRLQYFADARSDFVAMANSPGIVTMPCWNWNRDVSMIFAVESSKVSHNLSILLRLSSVRSVVTPKPDTGRDITQTWGTDNKMHTLQDLQDPL